MLTPERDCSHRKAGAADTATPARKGSAWARYLRPNATTAAPLAVTASSTAPAMSQSPVESLAGATPEPVFGAPGAFVGVAAGAVGLAVGGGGAAATFTTPAIPWFA